MVTYKVGDKVWFHNKLKGIIVFSYKDYIRLCIQSLDGQILYVDSNLDEIRAR